MLMVRSAEVVTVVDDVELLLLLFGSAFCPETVAVLFNVPVNAGAMFAVSVNCADAPFDRRGMEQLTVPAIPTTGMVHNAAGPVFCVMEAKVVPDGRLSLTTALTSVSGPLFVTVIVQAIVLPAVAVGGAVFVTDKSELETVVTT